MVDAHAFDYFFPGNLAKLPPALERHPGRKVGDWSDNFCGIAGAEREVLHALMNENSLEGIDFVGIQTCERQDSQEPSKGSKFTDRRTLHSIECTGSEFFNGRITRPIRSARTRLAYSSEALAKPQSWIFLPISFSTSIPHGEGKLFSYILPDCGKTCAISSPVAHGNVTVCLLFINT